MTRAARKPAFVLIMVLAVLAVTGTFLAMAARRSCRKATEAGMATSELQVRWGSLSCRSCVLPNAEAIMRSATQPGAVAASVRRPLTLGGMKFTLILSDEQAKVNVNWLASRLAAENLQATLSPLTGGGFTAPEVALRPALVKGKTGQDLPLRFQSLDQVFAFDRPGQLVNSVTGDQAAARLTCWSNGQVNFRRADAAVLRTMLQGTVAAPLADALAACGLESPDLSLPQALIQIGATPEQVNAAEAILTDNSGSHSLWVVAEDQTRKWYRLYIDGSGGSGSDAVWWAFQW
jgi:hypothetical protein